MKILRISLIAVITMLYSCDVSRVDVAPSNPTELEYFSDVSEFRLAAYGMYGQLVDLYASDHPDLNRSHGLFQLWRLPGDDLSVNNGAYNQPELFNTSLNAQYDRTKAFWVTMYRLLQRTNVVIEKVETVDWSGYEGSEEIEAIAGEAHFLRGLAHYWLFQMFGSVPIVTGRIVVASETNVPKSPAPEVLDQAIADLTLAEDLANESWSGTEIGRATKNSARSLLVKALVTRANYYGSTADYSTALTVFGRITNELLPDFGEVFSAFNENHNESAFEWQASSPTSGGGNFSLHNAGPWRGVEVMEHFRGNDVSPTNPLVNQSQAWTSDAKYVLTDKLVNLAGSDPRIAFWVAPIAQGLILEKYTKDGYDFLGTRNYQSQNNERFLRYGDIKLIAAEAALKSGSPGVAIGHINDVRARASAWGATLVAGVDYDDSVNPTLTLPAPRNTAETDEATIMGWIMEERFIELASEGHRWYDLVRWHHAGDIDLTGWGHSDAHFSTNAILASSPVYFDVTKHLLFPIPQDEIDRNSAINENNPKY